jgi:hypothetical protein
VTRLRVRMPQVVLFATMLSATAVPAAVVVAQTANSNTGLEGGQDHLFDAILGTPNRKTPVPQDKVFAVPPRESQAVPTPDSKTKGIGIPPVLNSISPGERQ